MRYPIASLSLSSVIFLDYSLVSEGYVISAGYSFLKENDDLAWTLLIIAGIFEIVWATLLKFTDGFTKVWPSVGTVVAMGISMVCLAFALRTIPMGTAYAVWTGIGAVGTVILGIVLFDEPKNAVRPWYVLG